MEPSHPGTHFDTLTRPVRHRSCHFHARCGGVTIAPDLELAFRLASLSSSPASTSCGGVSLWNTSCYRIRRRSLTGALQLFSHLCYSREKPPEEDEWQHCLFGRFFVCAYRVEDSTGFAGTEVDLEGYAEASEGHVPQGKPQFQSLIILKYSREPLSYFLH
uniref:Uncharacterized protein n=1 Tax=Oryza nivara TaxID=4536 RepID=A0A0E0IGB1_ORYNI